MSFLSVSHTRTHHNHVLSAQVSQNSELTPATRGTCCTTGLTQSHNILYVQLVACGNLMLAICEQQIAALHRRICGVLVTTQDHAL